MNLPKIEGRLAKILRIKPSVVTRAVFWKIPHHSKEEDIRLKLGRYKKPAYFDEKEEPESLEPKSELTLDQEEFQSLIEFLRQSYEPFRQGVKAFIPLDQPFDSENAKQIRALFSLPNKRELVRFILDNEVIPEELAAGLRQARRARAVAEFKKMLG